MRVEIEVRQETEEESKYTRSWWRKPDTWTVYAVYAKVDLTNEERAVVEARKLGGIVLYSESIRDAWLDAVDKSAGREPKPVVFSVTVAQLLNNYRQAFGSDLFARAWVDNLERKALPTLKNLITYSAEPLGKRIFEL